MAASIHDYVFRGNDEIPIDVAVKRIEKYRKKHPEFEECLNTLEKKAYPEGLTKSVDSSTSSRTFSSSSSSSRTFSSSSSSSGFPKSMSLRR